MSMHVQRSAVIEAIYNTVLWPEGWQPALDAMQRVFGADHIIINAEGQRTLSGTIGMDEAEFAALFDPESIALARLIKKLYTPGRATLSQELMPDKAAYERSEAYQRFVRPIGGYYGLMLCENGGLDIAICRGPRKVEYSEDLRRELVLLRPHILGAREIGKRLGTARDEARSLSHLIADNSEAVVLTDASGRIAMMNEGAALIAGRPGGIKIDVGDMIAAGTPAATSALRGAVARAAAAMDVAGKWIPLPGPDRQVAHFARVLSFSPGRFGFQANGGVCVAVFLKDATAPLVVASEALIELFGLTMRETEVVSLLIGGLPPREIAARLGVSLPTVRAHLAHIFDKTGTRTQAGLVALLSRLQL
jgi:DNA-binding CsgD family transcriptional regulator/PAS domain-containing protein